jgi:hypothetical protein
MMSRGDGYSPPNPAICPKQDHSGATEVPAMTQTLRFGRRVPLPATVQILHDLLVMERDEKARLKNAPEPGPGVSPPRDPLKL